MNDLSETVERLARSIEALNRRVSALEHPQRPLPMPAQPGAFPPVSPPAMTLPLPHESSIFSVLGKAMLGIAGAYLLRALAESAALPRSPVIALAIVYAFLWLIPAMRAPDKAWFASVAWGATSALILLPMLWELTLRFRILPGTAAAAILASFVIAASAIAWRHHFAEVAWVVDAAASVAALLLAIATRDLVPFIAALLLMAVIGEIAAARHRTLRVRPVVAAAADLAVFALIWIYSEPAASRAEYPAVRTAVLLVSAPALLLVYTASAAVQTLLLRRGISFFETTQVLVAALLSVWTVLAFWPGHGELILGVVCLLAAAAGYALAFGWFSRIHADRNYRVYATGSLALLLAGCLLSLSPGWLPLWLGCSAVAFVLSGVLIARLTLQLHALALLAAAAVSSGLFLYAGHALAGPPPRSPGWIILTVSVCAVLCYAAMARTDGQRWYERMLRLLFAGLAAGATAALLIWALVRLTAMGIAPGAEHVAVIRTLVSCALALLLAWSGSRRQHVELLWLAWAALPLIALKLLFEDLRHGRLEFTAISLSVFALMLLLLSRLLHNRSEAVPRSAG